MPDLLRFLLSDDFHINQRNFAPLFDFIRRHRVPVHVHRTHAALKHRLGDYDHAPELANYLQRLTTLEPRELFDLQHPYGNTPLRLFPLYRSEALAYALTRSSHWHETQPARDDATLFTRMYARDRDVLLGNAAAAMFWIDEYARQYAKFGLPFSHAFVFGGSTIFTRVLMQLCKLSATKCMVLESSFTGNQFYVEERYTPLLASPDIQLPAVRAALRAEALRLDPGQLLATSSQMMLATKNKNVIQPPATGTPMFAEQNRPRLLIVGQVVNDFSIIEQRGCPLSTLCFYRELIQRCLDRTDYNVIFKAHPWEDKKAHVRRPFTYDQLTEFRRTLPPDAQQRLLIVANHNLVNLGRHVDAVALLNSQAGLELAFHCGLRPATFGAPYYRGLGFTDDFVSVDDFLRAVQLGGARRTLELDEYDQLRDFLGYFLGLHCIDGGRAGFRDLERRLLPDSSPRTAAAPKLRGQQAQAKALKLLRNPRRFVRDSRVLQRFLPRK